MSLEKHVQCKLTEDKIIELRAATHKGTTRDALIAAVDYAIANMKVA